MIILQVQHKWHFDARFYFTRGVWIISWEKRAHTFMEASAAPRATKYLGPVCSPLTSQNLAPPIFQFPHNSEKMGLHDQNQQFSPSEGDIDRKPAPQESESASIRSASSFATFTFLMGSRDQFWKTHNWKFRKFSSGQVSHTTFTYRK